jgi:hypothetical protein
MGYLLAQFTMPPSTLRLVADVAMGTFVVIWVFYLVSARYEKRSVFEHFLSCGKHYAHQTEKGRSCQGVAGPP